MNDVGHLPPPPPMHPTGTPVPPPPPAGMPAPPVAAPRQPLVTGPWSVRSASALFVFAIALIAGLNFLMGTQAMATVLDAVYEWARGASPLARDLAGFGLLVGSALAMYVPLAVVVIMRSRRSGPLRDSLGLRGFNPLLAFGLVIGGYVLVFMANMAWGLFLVLLGQESVTTATDLMALTEGNAIGVLAVVVIVVVVAPLVEEFVFRGVIYPALKARWGIVMAMGVSSALFGILHLDWRMFVPTAIIGLIAAFIYEQTRSLWTSIAFHAFNNGVALLMAYVIVRFLPEALQ